MKHDISLDEALQQFLFADDSDETATPSSAWLQGPLPHEYEAHVLWKNRFTAEQLAWVQEHPVCQRTLAMFEEHYRAAKAVVLAPNHQDAIASEAAWDDEAGHGRLDLAFPATALAGTMVFLQRVGQGLVRVSRLDALRRTSFSGLAAGEYRVVPSWSSGFLGIFAAVGQFTAAEAANTVRSSLDLEKDFPADGLHVSAKPSGPGEISITFTSTNPELDGAFVHFAFSEQNTGVVVLSGAVQLREHPSQPTRWQGTWQYPLDLPGGCEFTFTVERA